MVGLAIKTMSIKPSEFASTKFSEWMMMSVITSVYFKQYLPGIPGKLSFYVFFVVYQYSIIYPLPVYDNNIRSALQSALTSTTELKFGTEKG